MSGMREAGRMLKQMQDLLAVCEPCPEKDEMQARFDLMIERFRDYPRRVAMQAPFADADEAEGVMRTELEFALSAWDDWKRKP